MINKLCLSVLLITASIYYQTSFAQIQTDIKTEIANTYYEVAPKLPSVNPQVLRLAVTAYCNARSEGYDDKQILTIVDYSKPSNEKRLWVVDVKNDKVLYSTYVAHGSGSGYLYANRFSNKTNSHQSSLGLFETEQTYSGSVGYALRLKGLDAGYNDHALSRAIVVHGAEYADPEFIDKYGRLGRSQGCFALPENDFHGVIDTIQDHTLIFAYYPQAEWLHHSRFLQSHT